MANMRNATYSGNRLDGNAIGFFGDVHGDLHLHSSQPESRVVPFFTVPFNKDPDFVDRPETLAWVHEKCAVQGGRAALAGLGGVGKSQLAIQYAHDVRDKEPQTFVFWIYASSRIMFERAYRDLANKLQLRGREDPKADVLRLVSDWLCDEANGKWTMILDNVDEMEILSSAPEPLTAYLPQARNGSILITSRNKDVANRLVGNYKNIKEVSTMEENQAMELLRKKLVNDVSNEGDAMDLLRALDCMPLAITQAAAFINRQRRGTIPDYLKEFRKNDKRREDMLSSESPDIRRDDNARNSIVTTWEISFNQIREQRPSAADLLSLMSFFNPHGIPESVLRRHNVDLTMMGWPEETWEDSDDDDDDEDSDEDEIESEFDEDIETLRAYSLVTETAEPDMCEMHALVQFCTQAWLSPPDDTETSAKRKRKSKEKSENWKQWNRKFVELMAREFPTVESEDWAKCQKLIPHVEPLCKAEPEAEDLAKKWAQLLSNAGWYMWMRGRYGTAQEMISKSLFSRERLLRPADERTFESMTVLALVLQDLGKYKEAEKLNRRALEMKERELGPSHPSTLASMHNLASVLRDQGQDNEAEKMYLQILEVYEKWEEKLGSRNLSSFTRSTLSIVNNMAEILQNRGDYEEAGTMTLRALRGYEEELSPHHPLTLISMNNFLVVLNCQEKNEEAEKLGRQALEACNKELGAQHPLTLTLVHTLGSAIRNQKRYQQAEELFRKAVEGQEKVLGPQHSLTLQSTNSLAMSLSDQGRHNEAEKLLRRALEGFEKELGTDNPLTLLVIQNLASALRYQGQYKEAEKLCRRALEGRQKTLGQQHPDTLQSVNSLKQILRDLGKYDEIEKLDLGALDIQDTA